MDEEAEIEAEAEACIKAMLKAGIRAVIKACIEAGVKAGIEAGMKAGMEAERMELESEDRRTCPRDPSDLGSCQQNNLQTRLCRHDNGLLFLKLELPCLEQSENVILQQF